MAFVHGDRVKETSLSTGTGTIALGGPTVGFRSFAVGVGIGNETFYAIVNTVDNAWEMGRGTVGPGTLSRNTVISSSNSNLLVNFTAGQKVVYTTVPSQFFAGALDAAAHQAVDHTAAPFNLLDAPAHEGVDHTAAPFNLISQSTLPAQHQLINHTAAPFNLLSTTGHQAVDHTAAPFNLLTSALHQSINHTAAPLNLLNAAAHQGVDHTAAPFNLLSVAAHALIDHSSIPGALSALQRLTMPKGFPWMGWWPSYSNGSNQTLNTMHALSNSEATDWCKVRELIVGGATVNDNQNSDQYGSYVTVDCNSTDYVSVFADNSVSDQYVNTRARFVVKLSSSGTGNARTYVGFGDLIESLGTTTWNDSFRHVALMSQGGGNWNVVYYTTSIQPSINTGVAPPGATVSPQWLVFDWSATPSLTIQIYDTTPTLLFTTTLTGAQVPPTTTIWPTIHFQSPGGNTADARLYGAIYSVGI